MSTQDRGRGAASAGHLSSLTDSEVAFLLRHSNRPGVTTDRYILLKDGQKVRYPTVLARECIKDIEEAFKDRPDLIQTFLGKSMQNIVVDFTQE